MDTDATARRSHAVARATATLHAPISDALDVELDAAAHQAVPVHLVDGYDTNWPLYQAVQRDLRQRRAQARRPPHTPGA